MDQELLMKQIVEQVMHAMQNGGSAPAAPGGKITAANYPLAEKEPGKIKTPTGKPFSSLSYDKVISGELTADDMRISPETLEMQAQVAESVNREAFAGNLRRAAELIAVPDERLLEITMRCAPTAPPSRSSSTSPTSWTRSTAPRRPPVWCARPPRSMRSAAG